MSKRHRQSGLESLVDFKHKIEFPVRWGEMDALGHVNNTTYLKWVEVARVDYLMKLNGELKDENIGPIVARLDCTFIYPVHFPDTVKIGFKTTQILEDRMICEARIFSEKHQKLCAISHNTIMAYNFKKPGKVDIPDEWRAKISIWEEI